MAENTSQKKLGELFVELGTKGAGKMMGTLNGVSAQFLLTKNAAMQAVKPIVDFTKNATNSAVNIQKLSVALGTSTTQVQKMQAWLKEHSLSESLLGDVEGLSSKLQQFWEYGIISPNMLNAFRELKMDISDYDDSLEGTLKLLDDFGERIKNLDTATQRRRLGEMDLSTEFLYAYSQIEGGFSNLPNLANTLSEADIEANAELKKATERFKIKTEKVGQKVLSQFTPSMTKNLDSLSNKIDKIPKMLKGIDNAYQFSNQQKQLLKEGKITQSEYWQNLWQYSSGKIANTKNMKGEILPNGLQTMPELDTLGQSNLTGNKTINVYQDIRTSDPVQAGNISANKIKQAERDVAEIQNLPPL